MGRSPRRIGGERSRFASKGDDPDSNTIAWEYNELGTDYLAQGMYTQAKAAFQYVLDHFAHLKAANYALVHIILCYKETDADDLIDSYLEDVASDCANPELEDLAWCMSVSQLCRQGDYQRALDRCQWLLSDGCQSEMEKGLRLREGLIYRYGLGDDLAAMTVFQDFIRRYPDDALTPVARVELEILGYNSDLPKSPTGDPVIKPAVSVPKKFTLYPNYPNPFNAYTSIMYDLPEDSRVSMKIYNVLGQRVETLVNEGQRAGNYTVLWDGRNGVGTEVASGIYFIRLEAGAFSRTRKMVLLR
jgi:tetratricopeptide (TPR) repeat protein